MNDDDLRDLMPLYLLGQLDDDQQQLVRDRLQSGCPRCAGYLAEAEATLANLPLSLDPVAPPAHVKSRLMDQIEAAAKPAAPPWIPPPDFDEAPPDDQPPGVVWKLFLPAAAAAVAVLVTWAVMNRPMTRQQQQIQALRINLAARQEKIDHLEDQVQSIQRTTVRIESELRHAKQEQQIARDEVLSAWQMVDDLQAKVHRANREAAHARQMVEKLQSKVRTASLTKNLLGARRLTVASLEGTPTQPEGAWGRLFWDHDRQVWHFYTDGLKPAEQGKTYELWIITAEQEKIPAGTFDVDEGGRSSLIVNLPQDIGPIAMAAVTDEPAGGVPQPTGSIQLAGSISVN